MIGGGVEEASRAAMPAACAVSGRASMPMSGQQPLAQIVETWAKRT